MKDTYGSNLHTKRYIHEGTCTRRDIHTHGRGIHTKGDTHGGTYTCRKHTHGTGIHTKGHIHRKK